VTAKVQRYEAAAERSYYRAIRELTKLQKARKQEGTSEIRSVQQNQQEQQTAPEPIRSVPQNAPETKPFKLIDLPEEEILAYLDKKYPYPLA
jgi:hypothetical protein